jgi:oligoendopeptidase F
MPAEINLEEAERKQRDKSVKMLAEHFGMAEDQIRIIYEEELDRLRQNARVREFLSVLITRKVRDVLIAGRRASNNR